MGHPGYMTGSWLGQQVVLTRDRCGVYLIAKRSDNLSNHNRIEPRWGDVGVWAEDDTARQPRIRVLVRRFA